MEPGKDSEKIHGDEKRFREIEKVIGPLHIDSSHEWISRLKEYTEGDPNLCLHYLRWTRIQKSKNRQIHIQPPLQWLDQVANADFSNLSVAFNLRRSLYSKEVDYLEIALDKDLREIFIVLPDPGSLPVHAYPITELPETSIADEGLQMHPTLLSLSILGDPEAHIPKLVLPVGRLVRVDIETLANIELPTMREPESLHVLPDFTKETSVAGEVAETFEKFRRELWKHVKESKTMKDTDYFVVIDVVTPGCPVWIIYNPDQDEDSEDPTTADLLQSTLKFPQLDSKSGFGAAQIFTGIKNWLVPRLGPQPWVYPYPWDDPYLWEDPDLGANPHFPMDRFQQWLRFYLMLVFRNMKTIDEIKANFSRTRIPYPVVGRLENMKIAEQVLSKAQST